jgi:hypothetical protein
LDTSRIYPQLYVAPSLSGFMSIHLGLCALRFGPGDLEGPYRNVDARRLKPGGNCQGDVCVVVPRFQRRSIVKRKSRSPWTSLERSRRD